MGLVAKIYKVRRSTHGEPVWRDPGQRCARNTKNCVQAWEAIKARQPPPALKSNLIKRIPGSSRVLSCPLVSSEEGRTENKIGLFPEKVQPLRSTPEISSVNGWLLALAIYTNRSLELGSSCQQSLLIPQCSGTTRLRYFINFQKPTAYSVFPAGSMTFSGNAIPAPHKPGTRRPA